MFIPSFVLSFSQRLLSPDPTSGSVLGGGTQWPRRFSPGLTALRASGRRQEVDRWWGVKCGSRILGKEGWAVVFSIYAFIYLFIFYINMSFYFSGINFFVNSSYIEIYSSHTIQFIDLICFDFFLYLQRHLFIWLYFYVFIFLFIYWRIITLQYYVGFCHTYQCGITLEHRFAYVPSVLNLPPASQPILPTEHQIWSPCVTQGM